MSSQTTARQAPVRLTPVKIEVLPANAPMNHHIIKQYIEQGGAAMSEEDYQRYKLALLSQWLEKERMFDCDYFKRSTGETVERKTETAPKFKCTFDKCTFFTKSIESAIDHLVKHYPEMFVDQNQSAQNIKAGAVK